MPSTTRPLEWLMVDGSSVIFRAFYGVPQTMTGPSGIKVNAIRGTIDYLARFVTERQPRRLVVATDEDWRPQWRVDALPTYKSHRVAEPVPPDLVPQMAPILHVLAAVGIPAIGRKDYEAEDIIASLVSKVSGRIEILSGDRDLFSLVRDPDVVVLYPQQRGETTVVDEAEITRRYGIPGRSYGDYAILRGDPSDGLPGLRGVGDKTAAAMVRQHGDLAGVLANGKLGQADADYLRRAMKVVLPVTSIGLEVPDAMLPRAPKDADELERLKVAYGLGGAVERLLKALAAQPGI